LEDSEHAFEDRVSRVLAIAREKPDRLLCVVGPTASGKTDLAVAVCERVGGEVISADSVQIYRCFDIGSGKPSLEEQARAPHHLIDAFDPLSPVDAVSYARFATEAIAGVRARGKIPVLVGGTYFWVRALVMGLAEAPAANAVIRAKHRATVEQFGRSALHAELEKIDAASAARLHLNDVVRVSRALEVFELSGRTMSEWQAEHGFRETKMDASFIGIRVEQGELTRRITQRVDTWLASGWLDEVRSLIDRGYGGARAMGSVGYKEVHAFVTSKEGAADTREVRLALRDRIVQSTRIFARRQRTWLHKAPVEWV